MKKLYIASFRYGKPALAVVDVLKENPQTYQTTNFENMIGRQYLPTRIYKHHVEYDVFDGHQDAIAWLCERGDAHVVKCSTELAFAKETSEELHVIYDTLYDE